MGCRCGAVAPKSFCLVERSVDDTDYFLRRSSVGGDKCGADRCGHMEELAVEANGLCAYRGYDGLRFCHKGARSHGFAAEDDELVAAPAGEAVGGMDRRRDPASDLAEHHVAGLMSVLVDDRLEVVDVDEQQCHLSGGCLVLVQQALEQPREMAAVEGAGEHVCARSPVRLGMGFDEFLVGGLHIPDSHCQRDLGALPLCHIRRDTVDQPFAVDDPQRALSGPDPALVIDRGETKLEVDGAAVSDRVGRLPPDLAVIG